MKKNYTKKGVPVIFLILMVAITYSQFINNEDKQGLSNAVLWKITGTNLDKPSYLFGTVHALDSSEIYLHRTVLDKLGKAEKLVFETDLTLPGYQQKALQYAMMKNDSLKGVLSKEDYEFVRDFFQKEFSFPIEAVKRIKPFYLASLVGSLASKGKSHSHEQELLNVAQKRELPITGISTLEKETEILQKISVETQADYLIQAINDYQTGASEIQKSKIIKAYKRGKIEEIDQIVKDDLQETQEIYKYMFVERNKAWVSAMIELMDKGSCFFAVGTGHLAGENGLIMRLRAEGYKVKPVKFDFWFHD